ncbi:hypothetical protein AMTRI_Chr05g63170 [Amborella trichopoda]
MGEPHSRVIVTLKLSLGFTFMMNFIKISHIFSRTALSWASMKNYQTAPTSELGQMFFFFLFFLLVLLFSL